MSPDLRDELLVLVSHELRTPLTVIASASRVLNRHPAISGERDLAAVVDDLMGAARRMERVIGNMLLLANIESDAPSLEPVLVRVAVSEAIEGVVSEFPSAEVIIVGDPDPSIAVEAVPAWFHLIIVNLLTNAYQHGARRHATVVQWEGDETEVRVHVCSSGDELTPEALDRWFEPFYRRVNSREYPGAGLGLTVARSLARGQGGDLSARPWESEPGTRMTLTLPGVPPEPGPDGDERG